MTLNSRGHLSSETMDLLLLSSLAQSDVQAAQAHLDACAQCRTRFEESTSDKQHFDQYVAPRTLAAVEARAEKRRLGIGPLHLRWLVPLLSLGTAAVVLMFVRAAWLTDDTPTYLGIKGATPSMQVFAVRGDGAPFRVLQGQTLRPKDRLRFTVNPAAASQVMVVSVDGAGAFSVYHPIGETASAAVTPGAMVELNSTVELDETLGSERVTAVFGEKPFTSTEARAAAARDVDVEGLKTISIDVVKEAP